MRKRVNPNNRRFLWVRKAYLSSNPICQNCKLEPGQYSTTSHRTGVT